MLRLDTPSKTTTFPVLLIVPLCSQVRVHIANTYHTQAHTSTRKHTQAHTRTHAHTHHGQSKARYFSAHVTLSCIHPFFFAFPFFKDFNNDNLTDFFLTGTTGTARRCGIWLKNGDFNFIESVDALGKYFNHILERYRISIWYINSDINFLESLTQFFLFKKNNFSS